MSPRPSRPALRHRRRSHQPVADDPRIDRHSTELDRVLDTRRLRWHVVRDARQTEHAAVRAPMMHVTGDRQVEHGLSTIGYDDEGVAAQTWDIVRGGVLVESAGSSDGAQAAVRAVERLCVCRSGRPRAAAADAERIAQCEHKPITLSELLAAMGEGLYIVRRQERSIDMQRTTFSSPGRNSSRSEGQIVGQVKDVAYQSRTTISGTRWRSWAVRRLCARRRVIAAKEPGQIAPVSHGCPAALFRQVNISTPRRREPDPLQDTIDRC